MILRDLEEKDLPRLLELFIELAEYEDLAHEVVATTELLKEQIIDNKYCNVILCEVEGVVVGYALYFYSFSTFLGRAGIFLEDLYIQKEHRNCGYGKLILKKLAQICVDNGFGRLEWNCLDTNSPSIEFYLSLNARPMSEWTGYRLTGQTLLDMANI